MLCVTLSLLTINAASLHIDHQLHASHELASYQLDQPALPRKLMFNNKISGFEVKDLVSYNGQNKAATDESHKEEVKAMMHAAKGTRQEWIEGSDPTHEFFTMDYSHVRRRRPIHNKSFRH
ncbi:hypothetical protein HanRHA438_Chr15g0698961 [Helianthus annuus]|uniref:uncharacterized protein LOC110909569 n=1 Tax=Helianthus annuus TaxID=4232 RepID=UPI000B901767|nr:uncharacterized protein LOC110909569 [Helianthus annuus]KAJ0454990.1 hypothetical protein HanIR_Chr15g0746191 [Helianthus annuus]KAJ0844125.1 hypothetical protein HanRHA438_Chr15g0698961 [Helianthus annuus]